MQNDSAPPDFGRQAKEDFETGVRDVVGRVVEVRISNEPSV
jgi:hypothetical protein